VEVAVVLRGGLGSVSALSTVLCVSLACGGLGGAPEVVDGVVEPDVPEPEEAESPLVLDQAYEAEDQSLTFDDDGTCEHVVGNTYACTWTTSEADGAWKVEITGYTAATDPEGATVEVDREAGATFEVAGDGASLTGPEGLSLALAEGDEGDEGEGDEGGEGEGDEGGDAEEGEDDGPDAAPRPRPAPKEGAQGARPRDGSGGDEGGTKAGKGKAKAKPR
jgi:hypothetical protein